MKLPLVLLFLISFPLLAQQQQPRNEVSGSYGRIEVEDALDLEIYGASYNRYWTRQFSTRVGILSGSDVLPDDNGDASSRLLHGTVEFHPFSGRLFSPHVGFGGAYVRHYEDYLDSDETDSRLTTVVLGGIDVNFTPRFAIGADALYSAFGVESGNDRFARDLTSLSVFGSARFRW
ncbi:MAG TPA: outer membrane beta-barrel protein [Thermoanaerobaculia bacterium]|nr:outer membrane beta-barrel protein [Thermoanaerobaculia bacterium]